MFCSFKNLSIILVLAFASINNACAEQALIVVPGLIPYMDESEGHVVVAAMPDDAARSLALEVAIKNGAILATGSVVPGQRSTVGFPLEKLSEGETVLYCRLLSQGNELAVAETSIAKFPPQPHAVQIDNRRRGLLVGGRPFFPIGFYSGDGDSATPEYLAEQGFNLYSPYSGGWHGSAEKLDQLSAWLDRCAAMGVKVNYDIRWDYYFRDMEVDENGDLIDGGTWQDEMPEEQREILRKEIETFRDHPAILAWYIADEPHLGEKEEENLRRLIVMRDFVKELDPYHPVTIVFHEGQNPGPQWLQATDVTWINPYMVNVIDRDQHANPYWQAVSPDKRRGVSSVIEGHLSKRDEKFNAAAPLWFSPQIFGGGSPWSSYQREPSASELRSMTYAGILQGASAVQFYTYQHGQFPTSPRLMSEASMIAQEIMELAPFLLSEEPPREVVSRGGDLMCAAWQDKGMVAVIAINPDNAPAPLNLKVANCRYSGLAEVLFENREVKVVAGVIRDTIESDGVRVYQIPEGPFPTDMATLSDDNLRANPSFEHWVNSGSPGDIFVRRMDVGSTVFLDTRTAVHGRHSLRLTSANSNGILMKFNYVGKYGVFDGPAIEPGGQYRMSIWAKADRPGLSMEFSAEYTDKADDERLTLGTDWKEYTVDVTVLPRDGGEHVIGPKLTFESQGTVWLDLFQVVPIE